MIDAKEILDKAREFDRNGEQKKELENLSILSKSAPRRLADEELSLSIWRSSSG